ncbi:hypothetical protein [Streptomyces sp. NPDC090445]|uniref:VMAP-C domain-containing protein n=1 Tax=Streptomyces sp. NPDC090445 TaxID=3365963 RepID=UPI0037F8FC0E
MTDHGQPGPTQSHPAPTTLTALRSELQEQLDPASANPVLDVKALLRLLVRNRAPLLKDVDRSAPPDRLIRQLVAWCITSASRADALADALEHFAGLAGTEQPDAAGTLRMLSDLLAARTLMEDEDLRRLQHLVEPRTVPTLDLHRLVQACLPPLSAALPQHCTSTWPTALHLLRRNVLPGGLPPLLAFIEYLAAAQSQAAVDPLRAWTEEKAGQWGVLDALQACREAAARHAGPTPSATPRIMFAFLPDGLRSDLYTLRTWHREADAENSPSMRGEDAQVDRRDIADAVYGWLQKWPRRPSPAAAVSVEFWLPLPLVNQPVWDWCTRSTPPQAAPHWNVVVRSLDRLQSPTLHRTWRTRWQHLMDDAGPASAPAVPDGPSRRPAPPQDLVVLSNPPDGEAGRNELMTAIRQGAPAILWHREDCASPAFRTSVQQLIEQGPLKDLPSRVSALRQGTGPLGPAEDEETVRGISLLWDDPDQPLPAMPALVAPSEAL